MSVRCDCDLLCDVVWFLAVVLYGACVAECGSVGLELCLCACL